MQCLQCQSDTTNPKFCTQSCAATYNNTLKPKRTKIIRYKCLRCDEPTQNPKYCSLSCQQAYGREGRIAAGSASAQSLRLYLLSLNSGCSVCLLKEWQNESIPLEIDHIDGHAENNILENVRLLCPNCHAQTSTYKNRNKGNGRHARRQRYAEGKSY